MLDCLLSGRSGIGEDRADRAPYDGGFGDFDLIEGAPHHLGAPIDDTRLQDLS